MNGLFAIDKPSATRGDRRWCGPTAIAAILGCTYFQAAWKIADVRGAPFKNQSNIVELQKVLEAAGKTVEFRLTYKQTFAEFMKTMPEEWRGLKLLLRVTNHFVVVAGDTVCDSWFTRGEPMKFSELKTGPRHLVTHVLVVRDAS